MEAESAEIATMSGSYHVTCKSIARELKDLALEV
jgi:hypothetical protein